MNALRSKFLLVALVCLTVTVPANEAIDRVVASEMQRQKIPGVAVAVIRDGKVVKQKAYGIANLELDRPVTADTTFKIGSISKPMIAIGVMRLVEEGKIDLDDPVGKHLTEAPAAWGGITIRHLLSHTSGLVREASGFDPFKVQRDADVIATGFSQALEFSPGERYQYSNLGYFSLAEIITRVSGKPWSVYLDEILFRPLNMRSTRVTSNADIIPNRAGSYDLIDGKHRNAESYRALRPSGAFFSTLKDMTAFALALDGKLPIKRETLATMQAAYKLRDGKLAPYGLGWSIDEVLGKVRVGHGGTLSGFRADLAIYRADKLTIVVLTNLGSSDPILLSTLIADEYIDFPQGSPAIPSGDR